MTPAGGGLARNAENRITLDAAGTVAAYADYLAQVIAAYSEPAGGEPAG